MKTLIRIAEVWVPSPDGTELVLASGLFPGVAAFEAITREMVFLRGEGLPGRAWEAGHPLMLRQLVGSYFKRAAAARAIDLTCAVAIPVFQGPALRCVVVMLMGGASTQKSAAALWRPESRITSAMTLVDGCFGLGDFDATREPTILADWLPSTESAPLRADPKQQTLCLAHTNARPDCPPDIAAQTRAIARVLAMPCGLKDGSTWVLTVLAAATAPIARRIEIWREHPDQPSRLNCTSGHCEAQGALPLANAAAHPADALGAIGQVWHTSVAQAETDLGALGASTDRPALQAAGITSVLALPVMSGNRVGEVLALYF